VSEERDLEKDLGVARRLGQMSEPRTPADLAARIAARVTQLPQHSAAPAPVIAEAPVQGPRPARGQRWLGYAIGGAIAATAIGGLLLRPSLVDQPEVAAVSPPAAETPTAKPTVMLGAELDPRPSLTVEQAAPPASVKQALAATRKLRRSEQPPVEPVPARALDVPMQAEAVVPSAASQPDESGTSQAVMAPPSRGAIAGPMLPSGPSSGLGIAGSGLVGPGMPGSGPGMEAGAPPSQGPRGPRH
jgi:hypothetical protein